VLLRFLKDYFAPITNSLLPLLDYSEINFNLLWALFKPNTHILIIYEGSDQPRCLIYNLGNFKTSLFSEKSFELDYYYFSYNGKAFSEVKTTLSIPEFHLTIKITSLKVFPLRYYKRQAEIKQDFISNSQKFISLKGINYRKYKGIAFFWTKDGLLRFSISGRIIVDATVFYCQNSNYGKQPIAIDIYRINIID